MEERYELKEPEFEEESPKTKPITMDGAYRLSAAILISAHDDYVKALKTIQKLESYAKKIEPLVRESDRYDLLESEVAIIMSTIKSRKDNFAHQHELDKIEEFLKMKKPKKPKTYQIKKLYDYYDALQEKANIESFYKSKMYSVLTLGKGIPGEELIKIIKREVGYL